MNVTLSLHEACSKDDLPEIRRLISKGSDLNSCNAQGDTPLITAVREKHNEVVDYLLEQKNIDINALNSAQESALIIAVQTGNEALVNKFLTLPDIDLHIQSYFFGTALTCAIYMQYTNIALALLQKEKEFKNELHPGALHFAVQNGSIDLVKFLISKGANVNSLKHFGFKPLKDWIWKIMPYKAPFQFREKDSTPLIIAIQEREPEMVKLLLEHGANPSEGDKDQYPLLIAAEQDDYEIFDLLLNKGANLKQKIYHDEDISSVIDNHPLISNKIKSLAKNKMQEKSDPENLLVSPLQGELLESFCEVLLGEFEELADIKDQEERDLLFNKTKSVEEAVKYASYFA